MDRKLKTLAVAVHAAVMALSSGAVYADPQLEEIIVTARRREESAQSTPVAVSVLTANDLYREGIKEIRDLTALVPGVNMAQSGNNNNTVFSIRGMSRGVVGNIPLVEDMLFLRVAGLVDRRDGYTKNLSTAGKDFDDRHSDNFRVSLLFEPTKSFSNLTIYERNDTDSHGAGVVPYQSTGASTTVATFCGLGALIPNYAPYCNITRFLGD